MPVLCEEGEAFASHYDGRSRPLPGLALASLVWIGLDHVSTSSGPGLGYPRCYLQCPGHSLLMSIGVMARCCGWREADTHRRTGCAHVCTNGCWISYRACAWRPCHSFPTAPACRAPSKGCGASIAGKAAACTCGDCRNCVHEFWLGASLSASASVPGGL